MVCENIKMALYIMVNGESTPKMVGESIKINQMAIDTLGHGKKIKEMDTAVKSLQRLYTRETL